MIDSDERLLLAKITHLERTLRIHESENRHLRAQLRVVWPQVEQVQWQKPQRHYQNLNQQNGAEK